ncbi:MAG TPA: tetratricopeptide repeat protein, partial [Burkholderiales bacterium]|nr:tetratricopeptide repeat protein [Burkholderiales bacterium]
KELELAQAAITIARLEYPDLDPRDTLRDLDVLATEIRERLPRGARKEEFMAMICRRLFTELEFRGNEENYYDPRNSCLNAVLERKLGNPITLSILYMEIAKRLDLKADGISFPGHFLVRVHCDRGVVVIDPFNGGETLTEPDLRRRLAEVQGQTDANMADLDELLAPASQREILVRMLRNLKKIYLEEREMEKAIAAMSLILAADPNSATELRERGLLYREIEAFRAALGDLSSYLKIRPDAEDGEVVRHLVLELRAINARFN